MIKTVSSLFTCVSTVNGYKTCGKPATAVRVVGYKAEEISYAPICNFHRGIDKNRKYGKATIIDFTPQIIATLNEQAAIAKAEREAAAARKAAEVAARNDAAREREVRNASYEFTVVRDDDKERDWSTLKEVAVPRWRAVVGDAADPLYDPLYEKTVTVVQAEGRPTVVKVRNSSELTLNEARALQQMLGEALSFVDNVATGWQPATVAARLDREEAQGQR